ncbi:uncharacterized protein LOC123542394 [Mercenaria mercenaria]|uniref:uncharacterized protein LOC123542394 n=1 Tax=Mercenaria mercenaria TaxID=6596 RepID=UPI00234E5525|nr:uncharacterized protein LOC123542394 [Mercenaria mercenaria]
MFLFRNVEKLFIIVWFIVLFINVLPVASESIVCLQCDNLPHPWDCDRVVTCNSHESCYVEQVVTVSGVIVYNSGCSSEQKCRTGASLSGKRSSVLYTKDVNEQIGSFGDVTNMHDNPVHENPVDEVSVYETAEADLTTCYKCCNNSRYCNRNLCDNSVQPPHTNQTYCLSCPDVVQPSDCEYLVLCNPGELCYTEFINLNGEDRYRMGCVSNTACSKTPVSNSGPALVGKKRFVMDTTGMDKYCSKCCSDDVGNCNRELCDKSGVIPPGIEVSELVNPPERKDFCTDLFPDACPLLIIQNTDLCKEPRYSHYACREFCGTCINPGHVTARPSSTQAGSSGISVPTPTKVTTPQAQSTDCFYDSTKYMGSFATTVTGKACKNWVDLDPSLQGFPDISITVAGNKCRDLDGRGFPWCFTSNSFDWEFCPVPYCQECFYPSQSVQYAGYVAIDKDNDTCSSWTDYVAQTGDTLVKFPNDSVADAKNYCRDPKKSGTPQCYVNGVLQNCDVPQCTHDCRDDPETNCALVQQYVCKYEYTSATLCPKTCNMCKFGLLPPKSVDPPADICVDNPDANCAILQSIICADTDGALKLCPKTCQLCSLLYSRTTVGPATSTVQTITSPIQTTQTTVQTTMTSPMMTSRMTSPMTSAATTSTPSTTTPPSTTPTTTTPTTTPSPYWLPWGAWECKEQSGSCFQKRLRNCSTGLEQDCKNSQGGIGYNVGLCTEVSCPEFFTTTTTISTTTQDPCQDDPTSVGCGDKDILTEVCKEKSAAWSLCRRSCGLCDTCWDYLNCSTPGAQNLFCGREEYALQYCRQTCGKCSNKPVDVQLNKCGDPVTSELVCELLQTEICICNDPDVRALCGRYCDNKCTDHPYLGSDCIPARRKRRDAFLSQVMLH